MSPTPGSRRTLADTRGAAASGDPVIVAPATLRHIIRSETIKFRSLRSTLAVLGAAILAMLVVGAILGINTRHLSNSLDPDDTVPSSPLQGYYLGQLLLGALGVLFVTSEYSSGMIRTTLTAVPRRVPVLRAKLIVFVAATLMPLIVASIAAFLIGEGIISHYRTGFSLTSPGAARVVIGTGVFLTLVGVIGSAIGWLVRNVAGALVTYIAVMLVIPDIFSSVLGTWGKYVSEVLPSSAGEAFVDTLPDGYALKPWVGLLVMVAWVVAFVAAATAVLRLRDA